MDFAADVSATAASVSETSADMYWRLMIFLILGVVGFVGRLLFMAVGPSVEGRNPLRALSGAAMLGLGMAMIFGTLVVMGKGDKVVRLVRSGIVDPYVVQVLGRDSCDPTDGSYCVVVFDEGREIAVNWFDRRVNMFDIAHPVQGAVASSPRPAPAPGRIEVSELVVSTAPSEG